MISTIIALLGSCDLALGALSLFPFHLLTFVSIFAIWVNHLGTIIVTLRTTLTFTLSSNIDIMWRAFVWPRRRWQWTGWLKYWCTSRWGWCSTCRKRGWRDPWNCRSCYGGRSSYSWNNLRWKRRQRYFYRERDRSKCYWRPYWSTTRRCTWARRDWHRLRSGVIHWWACRPK